MKPVIEPSPGDLFDPGIEPRSSALQETSLMAQMVKNLPAVQETWVRSLGQNDPLEKGMATYSSIPACRTPWTEEPDGLQW